MLIQRFDLILFLSISTTSGIVTQVKQQAKTEDIYLVEVRLYPVKSLAATDQFKKTQNFFL